MTDWSFEANLERGCLPTGEPLEARYGTGWWSREPRSESDCPPIVQCPHCNGHAYDLGNKIDCENCGIVLLSDDGPAH